jgi:NADPH:quinone reductase-like Zn-dependent oxidoreductase
MKALQFDQLGSLEALKLVDLPRPAHKAGEALIEVHAAGLNPSDVKNVLGLFTAYTTLPRVPGRDFAGVVVEGPPEWLGREVWGSGRDLGFFHDGSHAEYMSLPVSGLSQKPASLSFAQAASCGVPFTTAINALDRAGVAEGTQLLVIGAAGAVGSAAVALARLRGAEVIAAVRKDSQAAALRASGVTTITLDPGTRLAEALKPHAPAGAEVIFDTTGFWLAESVDALARLGRIAVIAAPLDQGHVRVPVLNLYRRGGLVVGINTLLYDVGDCAAMLSRMVAGFDAGQLQPPAGLQLWPIEGGLAAYEATHQGGSGKAVLSFR